MDILLVLGTVTKQHYGPITFAMLDRGLKPKVVRVDTKLSKETDFFDFLYRDAVSDSQSLTHLSELMDSRTEALKQSIIRESFGLGSLDEVKAIVFEPLGDDESSSVKMAWLTDQISGDYAQYTVNVGNDGNPWLQGEGYGDLEIPPTK